MQNTSVEKTGRTVAEAVAEALAELGAAEEEAEVEIIDEGHKGFLSIGNKPAVVRVTVKRDPVRTAKRFLEDVAAAAGVTVHIDAKLDDRQLNIDLSGDSMGMFIGKRGQTLDALQYLTNLAVNRGDEQYVSVTLDTEDYRKRRKETLETLAYSLAKKVRSTKSNVTLEPMSPYERRIIHSTLQNDRFVTTYSEGEDPYRNVVIALKRDGVSYAKKPYQKRASAIQQ